MSIVKKDRCDFCGKEVNNCYKEKGWVRIRGLAQITIAEGIEDKTQYKRFLGEDALLDFCCLDHFMEFVKKIETGEEEVF